MLFEGENEITLSKETAHRFFSKFVSDFLNSPIKVTNIESDYKGVTIKFTESFDEEKKEGAKEAEPETKEILE